MTPLHSASTPSVSIDTARVEDGSQASARRGITLRTVLLCLSLALLFGFLSPIIDHKLFNTFLGATHLPPGAIAALLFLLLVVNPLLGLASRRLQFSQDESLTVYITCLFSCLVPGHGAENLFVSNLLAPFYYATRENKWLDTLLPNLPEWITPALSNGGGYDEASKAVVDGWYNGLPAGEAIPWGAWLVPLAAWSALIFASYLMLACLGVILRAQWAQREALSFPLLRLPIEMTQDLDIGGRSPRAAFFRSPMMWSGFAVAVAIQIFNGLNFYFPDVPAIPLGIDTTALLTEAPWNQIGKVDLRVWPMAVGITYLLTAEVSFSLWFFYWLLKLQFIVAYSLGYVPAILPSPIGWIGPATRTFASSQQVGAFLTFALILLWTGREHFRHVARRAFGLARPTDIEKSEAMSYPLAFWGFAASFAFLIAWSVAAGVRLDIALGIWLSYLAVAIVLTRMVVEAGLLFVQPGWTPLGSLAQVVGTGAYLSPSSVVPGALLQGSLMTDLRAFLLPSFVQSFKLAHDRKLPARPLLALIFVCIVLTFGLSVWQHIRLGYQGGGGLSFAHTWWITKGATNSVVAARELTREAMPASATNALWVMVGGGLTWALMLARSRLAWFPLHPVGYLVGLTGPINTFWFSIFVGWLCKVTITRFGGTETYRKTTPLFLGLALGDVAMMVLWLAIDGWQGRTKHPLMPG